jgi:hypothetical protein
MLTKRMKWNAFAVLLTLALAAAPGFASPITVANFSFETLPGGGLPISCNTGTGTGCSFDLPSVAAAIPSWTANDPTVSGQLQPGTPANGFFNTLSNGPTSAYVNAPTVGQGMISQTVLPVVALGVTYTLLVDIGARLDTTFAIFNGSADLLINGNVIAATGLTPVVGTFGTFTATYTGLAADVGDAITIQLRSNGRQGNFDNVRLSDSTVPTGAGVPEPASFLLIGSALLALTAIRRRHPKAA